MTAPRPAVALGRAARRLVPLCALAAFCACADELPETSRRSLPITNGVLDDIYIGVGRISGNGSSCTGTLVGSRSVLTAAHCLANGTRGLTFTMDEGPFEVVSALTHPFFAPHRISLFDIALLELADSPLAPPAPVSAHAPEVGMALTIVGMGKESETSGILGIRRRGDATVSEVHDSLFHFDGTLLSGTCTGDSGGPAFAEVGGEERIVGVLSRASGCPGISKETRVDVFLEWLATHVDDLHDLDRSPPEVVLEEPADGATVEARVTVRARASDDRPGVAVGFYLDGLLIEVDREAPFAIDLDLTPGEHRITARALDARGNEAEATATVTARYDAPTL